MLRRATEKDVAYVVEHMRPEDVKELWLASGKPAVEAVEDFGRQEYVAFVLARDNEPVAIFGATSGPGGVATMFRFATRRWPEVVREAVKIGRRVMLPMFAKSGVKLLVANPWAESDHKWLRLFGAKQVGGGMWQNGHSYKTYAIDLAV